MLTLRDWQISLLLNAFILIIAMIIPIKTSMEPRVEKKQILLELTPIQGNTPKKGGSISNDNIDIPLDIPEIPDSLPPGQVLKSYEPLRSAFVPHKESFTDSPQELEIPDWNMPLDPFLDQIPAEDPILEQDLSLIDMDMEGHKADFEFTWESGHQRVNQYMPLWDLKINEAISDNIEKIEIKFLITTDGYVTNVEPLGQYSLNEAWNGLLENWISRIVFEPGEEETGYIILYLGRHQQ